MGKIPPFIIEGTMAKTTIYDLQGQAHEMETVDARECVAEMGWTYEQEPDEKRIGPYQGSHEEL